MALQENSARMAESRYRSGESVPCSGVYRIHHAEHREDHDGILLEGQVFPPCVVCGEQVWFELLQASNPIEKQADFGQE
jgi:hypothetical protein